MSTTRIYARTALAFVVLSSFASATQAQLPSITYKIVGKDGRVTYTDQANLPRGADATPLDSITHGYIKEVAGTSPPTQSPSKTGVAQQPVDASQSQAEQRALQAESALKSQQCETARQNLASLRHGRVTRHDADGKRSFLSDSEITKQKARTAQQIQQSCSE